jgi:hypothetical protein
LVIVGEVVIGYDEREFSLKVFESRPNEEREEEKRRGEEERRRGEEERGDTPAH